jgi:light-regulated signal transduction histidine kinase (bacteriophytochrome)
MPQMDGYQVCRELKQSPDTREIPVIFLTALNEVSDLVKAFEVGGVDYINKPVEVTEVLARVENQLSLVRHKRELAEKNERLQHEIQQRQHAEQQLQDLNQELLRSNRELEQFAYVVSHDLQQPLSTINATAQLLVMKAQRLDREGAMRLAKRILEATYRMNDLIRDLLAYARLGSRELEFQAIDCNDIIAQVLADLRQTISETNARAIYRALPTVMGDRRQLIELFQNLISNAIKYSRESPPQIEITAEETDNGWQFSITDNGIGIDSQHFDEIFQIFKRLHDTQEYPGTGIGLTICKKIVEYHRGQIWVDSQVGVGSTFYFTVSNGNSDPIQSLPIPPRSH